jgi:SAM-dependent methyltransferase
MDQDERPTIAQLAVGELRAVTAVEVVDGKLVRGHASDDTRVTEDWDQAAATFDDEPDHGLLDPTVRAAWAALLTSVLPAPPARVLDVGCGTGSLAVLLAEYGYVVTGLDLSPRMVAKAKAKAMAHAVDVSFHQGDAADPRDVGAAYDVVLARHVVWALPDPAKALARWRALLAPGGVLVLVEGLWGTGAGLAADELTALVGAEFAEPRVRELGDPALWGRDIDDERYLLTAH